MVVIKKIAKVLFWVLLVLIAIYSTFIIVQKIFWKNKTPSIFGYKNFIVLSGSMEPTLNIGDMVIVKDTKDIKIDDIISFRVKNSVVTHRVFEIYKEDDKEYYITKGDNNNEADTELLNKKDIEGKFVFKIPYIGKIILFFQKPLGILTVFLFLGAFLLISKIKTNKDM